jgi:hypothetical protein
MKFIPKSEDNHYPRVELTRRNLTTLLAKLDEDTSERTIMQLGPAPIMVTAVEDAEHYSDRPAGPMLVNGEII